MPTSSKVIKKKVTKLTTAGWIVLIVLTLIDAFIIGIIYGTTEYYFPGLTQLPLGFYISYQITFYVLGLAIWVLILNYVYNTFSK